MLERGVYPAAVTPMTAQAKIDPEGMARLLAWFEAAGCRGAVVAGTNGEGPSLSAIEKRDLLRLAMDARGGLRIILGIATASLTEARWLCEQGLKANAAAALVMPPGYFREAGEAGIVEWFRQVMDVGLPVIVYNFPQRTGVTLDAKIVAKLSQHSSFAGVKDSSGDASNIQAYADVLRDCGSQMYVGNETLLWSALEAGWSGTISGAANVVPQWLVQICKEFDGSRRDSARVKFDLLRPCLEAVRARPQPATHKAVLQLAGILPFRSVRLPLEEASDQGAGEVRGLIESALGPIQPYRP